MFRNECTSEPDPSVLLRYRKNLNRGSTQSILYIPDKLFISYDEDWELVGKERRNHLRQKMFTLPRWDVDRVIGIGHHRSIPITPRVSMTLLKACIVNTPFVHVPNLPIR